MGQKTLASPVKLAMLWSFTNWKPRSRKKLHIEFLRQSSSWAISRIRYLGKKLSPTNTETPLNRLMSCMEPKRITLTMSPRRTEADWREHETLQINQFTGSGTNSRKTIHMPSTTRVFTSTSFRSLYPHQPCSIHPDQFIV